MLVSTFSNKYCGNFFYVFVWFFAYSRLSKLSDAVISHRRSLCGLRHTNKSGATDETTPVDETPHHVDENEFGYIKFELGFSAAKCLPDLPTRAGWWLIPTAPCFKSRSCPE